MSTAIRVENVSKRYRLGVINRHMLYQDLQSRWARWRGQPDPNAPVLQARRRGDEDSHEEFWALRDVAFDVREGESIGVIGSNGAGKSTLLKILSEITAPTSGRVLMRGRVASLLEVGTGFHQELTGRENVFLNGAILGMARKEIARKFDQIVDFSGVEQFIDTPVKRYSSGMRVRLAFAVAAHLEPEILIVDEVLAVGDVAFQEKCLNQMEESCRSGRTILFVSHNLSAVESLCSRGVVLEHGRLTFDGTQSEAIAYYGKTSETQGTSVANRSDRSGTGRVRVTRVEMLNSTGDCVTSAASGDDLEIRLHYENHSGKTFPKLEAAVFFQNDARVLVFQNSNVFSGTRFAAPPENGAFVCRIPHLPLPAGNYLIGFRIFTDYHSGELLDKIVHAADLTVKDGDFFGAGFIVPPSTGAVFVEAEWKLESL